MKKFLPFMLAVLTSLSANGHITSILPADDARNPVSSYTGMVGEPVANDDVSENNAPGTSPFISFLINDMLSIGPAAPFLVSVDLDAVTPGNQPTLIVPGEGTWTYDGIFILIFSPVAGFTGDPTPITYTLTENGTGLSDQATVTVKYLGKPTAVDDISSHNVTGIAANVSILANDTLSNGPAFPLSVSVDLDASLSGPQAVLFVPGQGSWSFNSISGVLTFSPDILLIGDPAPITYTMTENLTGLSDQATVTVKYMTKPAAVNDVSAAAPGIPAAVPILINDLLVNGAPPAPTDVLVDIDPAAPGNQSILVVAGEGTWTYNLITGILSFNALAGFTSEPTPITYTLTDSANRVSDPATVTVQYLNSLVAGDDVSSDNVPGSAVLVPILANDLSLGVPISPVMATVDIDAVFPGDQPFLFVPLQGTWAYDILLGMLTFTPAVGFTGNPAPITYTVKENLTGLSGQATVTVTYKGGLTANDDISSNNAAGSTVSVAILVNDLLANGLIPAPGDVSVDLDPSTSGSQSLVLVMGQGLWTYDPNTGLVAFTPQFGFTGNPTPISYTLTDSANDVSDPATVTVNYLTGSTGLVANDDISSNNTPGSPVVIQFLANDQSSTGPVIPLTVSVDIDASTPGNQLTLTVPGQGVWTFDGLLLLSFSPEAGLIGDPTPITYTLTENLTGVSDQATVTIHYRARQVVTTNDISSNNAAGSTVSVAILVNDLLADGSVPAPGDVSVDLDPSTSGSQLLVLVMGQGLWAYDSNTGLVAFTPQAGFTGDPTPISYTLTDSANNVSDPATVTVNYLAGSTGLVANDDISSNNIPGGTVLIQFLANDQSSTGPVIPFTVSVDIDASTPGNQLTLTVPGQGVWTFDGLLLLSFSPEAGLIGDPTPITYTLTDNATGVSDQATVTVQYLAPPVADSRNIAIPTPSVGSTLLLDGQGGHPVPLSGTDPQDGNLGAGRTFMITNVNGLNGNKLLYNNVSIISIPFTITNYDPSLLKVEFTGIGSTALSFGYLVMDSQGSMSNQATYALNWTPPLPVTLISFNAKTEGNQVVLSWATSEESNSDYFEIQRSGDGVNWQPSGLVLAAGQSSTVRTYSFTDEHPLAGQNLFRLKMVDTDHSYTYSQIRSAQINGGEKITMSPNPVSDMLTIDLPSWKNVSSLTIFDQSGRKRGSAEPTAKAKIDVRQFQAGIYLVVIHYNNGAIHSQRILVK